MTDLIKRIDALNAIARCECGPRFTFERCVDDECSCSYIWAIKDLPAVPDYPRLHKVRNDGTLFVDVLDNNKVKRVVVRSEGRFPRTIQNEWIPVDEKLPDEPGEYLVTWAGPLSGDGYTDVLYYGIPSLPMNEGDPDKYSWYASTLEGDYYYTNVIAWQPLPEAYKEGGSDE